MPDRWVEHDGRWKLQPGHWARGQRERDLAHRDDLRRMGNQGELTPRGRDVDGDGVPNRYDSRPNNPNRY